MPTKVGKSLTIGKQFSVEEGRSFDDGRPGDLVQNGSGNFLINETASRAMGGSVVGKRMSPGGVEGTVVGVVEDFHIQSLKQPIRPFALILVPQNVRYALLHIGNNWSPEVIASLESDWKKVLPDHPFEFKFFDEAIDDMYTSEIKLSVLIRIFAGIAVVIGCIGLFGLTSFSARTRRKEFAVRRVVGATQFQIIRLVGRELSLLFVVASIISVPLAWTLTERWLESFPFRVEPGWIPTLCSIALLGVTALATVLYQAVKSAGENPVLALKE